MRARARLWMRARARVWMRARARVWMRASDKVWIACSLNSTLQQLADLNKRSEFQLRGSRSPPPPPLVYDLYSYVIAEFRLLKS